MTKPRNTSWRRRGKRGGDCEEVQHTRPRPGGRGGTCWVDLEGQVRGHSLTLLCSPAGAKRNAPSGPLASSAPCAVTATMGVSVHPPPVPASVNLATKAHAARSGCAPRACMAQAAACPAPVMPTTPSGTNDLGTGERGTGVGWALVGRGLSGHKAHLQPDHPGRQ